jgi:hypothetical protein
MKRNLATRVLALLLCFGFVVSETACTVDQVLSDIDVAIQIAASLAPAVGTVSPADGAIITVFSSLASGGLKDIQAAYDAWNKSGTTSDLQKAQALVAEVKANLANELQTAHISDPKTVTAVTNWCNLLYSSLNAVEAALPALQSGQAAVRARAAVAPIPTPESIQARWTTEVCAGDAKCSNLVKVHHIHQKAQGSFWHKTGSALGEALYGG